MPNDVRTAIGARLAASVSRLYSRAAPYFPLSPRSSLARGEGRGEGRQHDAWANLLPTLSIGSVGLCFLGRPSP